VVLFVIGTEVRTDAKNHFEFPYRGAYRAIVGPTQPGKAIEGGRNFRRVAVAKKKAAKKKTAKKAVKKAAKKKAAKK
jgi:hypothetical protein